MQGKAPGAVFNPKILWKNLIHLYSESYSFVFVREPTALGADAPFFGIAEGWGADRVLDNAPGSSPTLAALGRRTPQTRSTYVAEKHGHARADHTTRHFMQALPAEHQR